LINAYGNLIILISIYGNLFNKKGGTTMITINIAEIYDEQARLPLLNTYLAKATQLAGQGQDVTLTGPFAGLAVPGRCPRTACTYLRFTRYRAGGYL